MIALDQTVPDVVASASLDRQTDLGPRCAPTAVLRERSPVVSQHPIYKEGIAVLIVPREGRPRWLYSDS